MNEKALREAGLMQICVWPDGEWILRDEYSEEEYRWSGDDYSFLWIPSALEEHEIDEIARKHVSMD